MNKKPQAWCALLYVAALGACESRTDSARDAGLDAFEGSAEGAGNAEVDAASASTGCTRERLGAGIDAYFEALAAHDPALAPLAADAKYTENLSAQPPGHRPHKRYPFEVSVVDIAFFRRNRRAAASFGSMYQF